MVDPTGGRVRHTPTDARRAHAAGLAEKRDAQLVAAAAAGGPRKAMLEVAAAEKNPQLVDDEDGQRAAGVLEALEERLGVLGDDAHAARNTACRAARCLRVGRCPPPVEQRRFRPRRRSAILRRWSFMSFVTRSPRTTARTAATPIVR
jgi:hypothetical protein